MATERLFPQGAVVTDFLLPLLVTPFMFICGDLLPKNLFLQRAQSADAPLGAAAGGQRRAVRADHDRPVAAEPGAQAVRQAKAPQELRLSLARRELSEMLTEGHEAGILRPGAAHARANDARRGRADPVRKFAAPAGRVVRVTTTMTKSDILRIAQGRRRTLLPIEDPQQKRRLVGFVRTVDLFLDDSPELPPPRPLVELAENETFLSALGKLHAADDALGHVVNAAGKTVGFVTGHDLREALFRAQ